MGTALEGEEGAGGPWTVVCTHCHQQTDVTLSYPHAEPEVADPCRAGNRTGTRHADPRLDFQQTSEEGRIAAVAAAATAFEQRARELRAAFALSSLVQSADADGELRVRPVFGGRSSRPAGDNSMLPASLDLPPLAGDEIVDLAKAEDVGDLELAFSSADRSLGRSPITRSVGDGVANMPPLRNNGGSGSIPAGRVVAPEKVQGVAGSADGAGGGGRREDGGCRGCGRRSSVSMLSSASGHSDSDALSFSRSLQAQASALRAALWSSNKSITEQQVGGRTSSADEGGKSVSGGSTMPGAGGASAVPEAVTGSGRAPRPRDLFSSQLSLDNSGKDASSGVPGASSPGDGDESTSGTTKPARSFRGLRLPWTQGTRPPLSKQSTMPAAVSGSTEGGRPGLEVCRRTRSEALLRSAASMGGSSDTTNSSIVSRDTSTGGSPKGVATPSTLVKTTPISTPYSDVRPRELPVAMASNRAGAPCHGRDASGSGSGSERGIRRQFMFSVSTYFSEASKFDWSPIGVDGSRSSKSKASGASPFATVGGGTTATAERKSGAAGNNPVFKSSYLVGAPMAVGGPHGAGTRSRKIAPKAKGDASLLGNNTNSNRAEAFAPASTRSFSADRADARGLSLPPGPAARRAKDHVAAPEEARVSGAQGKGSGMAGVVDRERNLTSLSPPPPPPPKSRSNSLAEAREAWARWLVETTGSSGSLYASNRSHSEPAGSSLKR